MSDQVSRPDTLQPPPDQYPPPPPPPPPSPAPSEGPTMSTPQTLISIFLEPSATFEALKIRPRFLVAGIITLLAFMIYYSAFVWKVGADNIARAQVLARSPDAPPEQIDQAVQMQNNPIIKVVTYAAFPLIFAIVFAAGAALYLLGTILMAKTIRFKQALSVWVYSSYPLGVITGILNVLVLLLQSPDDIDPMSLNSGVVRANPSILVDPKASPVLATILGSFDLFVFYGLFLAALGLRKMARLPSGSAWMIVLAIWFVGSIARVVMSLLFGGAY